MYQGETCPVETYPVEICLVAGCSVEMTENNKGLKPLVVYQEIARQLLLVRVFNSEPEQ